jgi:hypothetical protein
LESTVGSAAGKFAALNLSKTPNYVRFRQPCQ